MRDGMNPLLWMVFQLGRVPTEFWIFQGMPGSGLAAPIFPILITRQMAAKIYGRVQFVAHEGEATIRRLRS